MNQKKIEELKQKNMTCEDWVYLVKTSVTTMENLKKKWLESKAKNVALEKVSDRLYNELEKERQEKQILKDKYESSGVENGEIIDIIKEYSEIQDDNSIMQKKWFEERAKVEEEFYMNRYNLRK